MTRFRAEHLSPKPLASRTASSASASLVLWLMICLLAALSPLSAQTPDPNWNCTNDSSAQSTFTDCTGAANQTDIQFKLDVGALLVCQNYNKASNPRDVYETLRYPTEANPCPHTDPVTLLSPNGACDADIWKYRVGNDANFFYFELETVGSWNYDGTGAGRDFVLLIDADNPTELGREDLYYFYNTDITHVVSSFGPDGVAGGGDDGCATDAGGDGGGNWQASGTSAPIVPHRDTELADVTKRVGATNQATCDAPGANDATSDPAGPADPSCLTTTGGSSGFNQDWLNLGASGTLPPSWNWYRIIERTGTLPGSDGIIGTVNDVSGPKQIMQMAIRRNTVCVSGSANCTAPTQITTRACTSQSSTLGKDNFTWHDHQKPSDLPTWDHDCICPLGGCQSTASAVELITFAATADGASIRLEWETGLEVDNLGFNLYREVAGKRTPITPELIAGSALKAGPGTVPAGGGSYIWWDATTPGEERVEYWLEAVDLGGRSTWHGPIELQQLPSGNVK